MLSELDQPEALEQFVCFLLSLFTWHMTHIETKHDVLFNRPPRQQQWLLRHIAGLASSYHISIAIKHNMPLSWLIDAGDNVEERTLTTTTWPDQCHKLAWSNGHIDGPEHLDTTLAIAKNFCHSLNEELIRRIHIPTSP